MLRHRAIACLLILLLGLAGAGPARAGISLRVMVRSALDGETLRATITTLNQGPETARRLSYSLFLGKETARSAGADLLARGAQDRVELSLPFRAELPGSYGFTVRVDYHDPNGYPLSAVSWGLFAKGSSAAAALGLQGRRGHPLPGRPPALLLANPYDQPLKVELEVLAPAEFEPARMRRGLELAPGARTEVPLELANRAALSGSTYPLAGLVSYERRGIHHAAAAQALVTVSALSDPLHAWRPWLWALAGALLAAMLGLAWAARRRAGA
ncbi:MAG: hypothetical protein K9K66_13960 [Desulfarculaceae bacterium]|nr:hypothetical protein [Desulfarculaceae bacterium]MCF8074176.1 hypothetical protein [Desulfarculaceae bacterium]MCF8102757.1 hypothetical protein [Desulfarculaceae bacterium]MCF8116388.1 hypothetical protein [Desulfarculaceae bacterium]